MSLQKPQLAGYLLAGDRSNVIYVKQKVTLLGYKVVLNSFHQCTKVIIASIVHQYTFKTL